MVVRIPDSISAFRPERTRRGAGRRLRSLIGVDEEILDWTPELRPHYTKIGALVLTTSTLAALSMLTALVKFLAAPWPALIPMALFWGWLIFCVDSWLIAGTHGNGNAGRVFWVRLMLAALLGLFIAEPLLLKVFEPAVHRQVADDRRHERVEQESALKACNPVPYKELDAKTLQGCRSRHLLLAVAADPGGVTDGIDKLTRERDTRQASLDADQRQLLALQKIARRECAGGGGDGFSGQEGNGPHCKKDDLNAETFRVQHRLGPRQQEIAKLQDQINVLVARRDTVATDYANEMDAAIQKQLPPLQGRIGIPEEDKALEGLGHKNLVVFFGSWLLRLLLILVDCLPVLAKRLSGQTAYDRMVARQIATNEELHEADNELQRRRDLAPKQDELNELDRRDRVRQQMRDDELQRDSVKQDEDLEKRIDDYARRLRGEI
ncbi:DUF4407 domain-containing protein [Actinomadura opuntiae]|uniref:DUF4407 domain-containing protein n=1 Tax=Actinomadura sp. OS1-43 TaxID=604315 RepID=UPI00255AF765|nr:DUF4407 domain-containing protein [Actinomadura sp. OS1-43]MDL4815147.1 DUF4407 domain-containing protein [Actinomadura sp. OS1-43]